MLKSPANNTSLFLRSIVDKTIESSLMWSCNILGGLYKLQMITLLGKPPPDTFIICPSQFAYSFISLSIIQSSSGNTLT